MKVCRGSRHIFIVACRRIEFSASVCQNRSAIQGSREAPLCFAAVIAYRYVRKGAALAWQKTEELSVKFYDSVNDKLYAKEQHAKVLEEQAAEEKRSAERAAESSEDYSEESSEDYEPDELDD